MQHSNRIPILVTGGAGYIGSHTCKALYLCGFEPVTYDNLSLGHERNVRWGPLVRGDIRDVSAVESACRSHGVVAVIHFAAFAAVGESVVNPAKYYENNVVGTLYLLEGLRRASVNAIVMSSSCAVYGCPSEQPIDEETPTNPVNSYGASKVMCERLLSDFERAYGLRWAALRYFNACGADPSGDLGEDRSEETHLIPRALMWIQGHIENFAVYGTDYPTPDGTAVRDYIHVTDLADAHVITLRRLLDGDSPGIFNLGVGHGYSVNEILQTIERVTGISIEATPTDRRPGDPPILIANASRSLQALQFRPRYSDLVSIIDTAWSWHKKAHPLRVRSVPPPSV